MINFSSITKLSGAVTRSISAENVYGEKGKGGMAEVSATPQAEVIKIGQKWEQSEWARDMGRGWKVRPCIVVPSRMVVTLMDVDGPGVIQHMWLTVSASHYRDFVTAEMKPA